MNTTNTVESLGKKTAIIGGATAIVGEFISSQLLTALGANILGIGAVARAAGRARKKATKHTSVA